MFISFMHYCDTIVHLLLCKILLIKIFDLLFYYSNEFEIPMKEFYKFEV